MVLDVNHDAVESNRDRSSPLRITVCHRKELTLPYWLTAADMDQDAEPFQKLLHCSLVAGYSTLPLRKTAGRAVVLDEEDTA